MAGAGAHAASASQRFCDRPSPLSAQQQDRLLQVAALVRRELEASGHRVALISRSGLNLQRWGIRYSHAGLSLKDNETPWSVRQLYYACDERRPRLYDQGLAGFLFGTDDPQVGYVSIVWMPSARAADVERAAQDKARALRLIAGRYSANAFPFSLRYQNCNQWVAELLATAWGDLDDGADLRARAQSWLAGHGYAPPAVEVRSHAYMFAGTFVPWIRYDDHPADDRFALRFRTSLPAALEAFVRERAPGARRVELCHDATRVVIHEGWDNVPEGCVPRAGDRVIALD
ncbi:MAG: DUF2145 domain-containing protein [Burkholderiaceae bacterium]|nr:DUF2145 domain-containing protein [Burkholderiaceae bacterium]